MEGHASIQADMVLKEGAESSTFWSTYKGDLKAQPTVTHFPYQGHKATPPNSVNNYGDCFLSDN